MIKYNVVVIDEYQERFQFEYYENEYPSLMELIRDKMISDIGDCRGRVWCNTCVVEGLNKNVENRLISDQEKQLLNVLGIDNVRLSCQLFLNENLHNTEWKILDSRRLF